MLLFSTAVIACFPHKNISCKSAATRARVMCSVHFNFRGAQKRSLHCKKAHLLKGAAALLTQTNYSGISKMPQNSNVFSQKTLFLETRIPSFNRRLHEWLYPKYFRNNLDNFFYSIFLQMFLLIQKKAHIPILNQWLTSNCLTGLSLCIEIPPILASVSLPDLWPGRILKMP